VVDPVSSLILRFAGPAQSWGGAQLYPSTIQTERTPTRSGVLGLLACCLGDERGQWRGWIEGTRVWARVDRPGEIRQDYQTVNGVPEDLRTHFLRSEVAEHPKRRVPTVQTATGGAYNISKRKYLADAEFIVALEHDEHLGDLVEAAASPVFMPYLGRKAFSPTFPFVLGVADDPATTTLETLPTVTPETALEVYPIVSDRNVRHFTVTAPVASRKEQMLWASSHLSR
jgi:CRISPR system Cascade subunit CasD